jgi:hypothetical protein
VLLKVLIGDDAELGQVIHLFANFDVVEVCTGRRFLVVGCGAVGACIGSPPWVCSGRNI